MGYQSLTFIKDCLRPLVQAVPVSFSSCGLSFLCSREEQALELLKVFAQQVAGG